MKLNLKNIKEELKKRGFENISKEEINSWAIVLALEQLSKKLKN